MNDSINNLPQNLNDIDQQIKTLNLNVKNYIAKPISPKSFTLSTLFSRSQLSEEEREIHAQLKTIYQKLDTVKKQLEEAKPTIRKEGKEEKLISTNQTLSQAQARFDQLQKELSEVKGMVRFSALKGKSKRLGRLDKMQLEVSARIHSALSANEQALFKFDKSLLGLNEIEKELKKPQKAHSNPLISSKATETRLKALHDRVKDLKNEVGDDNVFKEIIKSKADELEKKIALSNASPLVKEQFAAMEALFGEPGEAMPSLEQKLNFIYFLKKEEETKDLAERMLSKSLQWKPKLREITSSSLDNHLSSLEEIAHRDPTSPLHSFMLSRAITQMKYVYQAHPTRQMREDVERDLAGISKFLPKEAINTLSKLALVHLDTQKAIKNLLEEAPKTPLDLLCSVKTILQASVEKAPGNYANPLPAIRAIDQKIKAQFLKEFQKATPKQKETLAHLQRFFGEKFEIPAEYKLALLHALKTTEANSKFLNILSDAEQIKRDYEDKIEKRMPLESNFIPRMYLNELFSSLRGNMTDIEYGLLSGSFPSPFMAQYGGFVNTQMLTDAMPLALQKPEEILKKSAGLSRYLNRLDAYESLAQGFPESQKEFARQRYNFWTEYNIWHKNEWERQEANDGLLVLKWTGKFAFPQANSNAIKQLQAVATLDLADLGELEREKQIILLKQVENVTQGSETMDAWKNRNLAAVPQEIQDILMTDPDPSKNWERLDLFVNATQAFKEEVERRFLSVFFELGK